MGRKLFWVLLLAHWLAAPIAAQEARPLTDAELAAVRAPALSVSVPVTLSNSISATNSNVAVQSNFAVSIGNGTVVQSNVAIQSLQIKSAK